MSTLKGVFPSLTTTGRKNFIQENVKNLRRMERCSRTDKAVGDQHKFQMNNTHKKTTSKYSNVVAKVNTSIRGNVRTDCVDDLHSNGGTEITEKETVRNISTPVLGKKNSVPVKKSLNASTNKSVSERKRRQNVDVNNVSQVSKINVASDPNIVRKSGEEENGSPLTETVRYKHRSVQTLEEKHIDRLYAEGVIRYPTKDNAKYNEELNKKNESNPMDQGDAHTCTNTRPNDTKVSEIPAIDERINAAKSTNKDRNSVANKIAIQLNGGVVPPNYRKGVVPKYIKDRKEALQKEEEAKAATLQADCPEGHVLLTEAERQETLSMLKKNYQDYVNELNTMPIKTDTLRARRRKMEIEKQLNKLEEGIKVFSRLKVYVKINA